MSSPLHTYLPRSSKIPALFKSDTIFIKYLCIDFKLKNNTALNDPFLKWKAPPNPAPQARSSTHPSPSPVQTNKCQVCARVKVVFIFLNV